MPFMLVHPAAAVPLYRPLGRYGVLSALIIGSLLPDMHYFLPFTVNREAAHSASGLLWFCWPLGILLYVLYHRLLKQPLALLLPPAIAARVAPWLNPGRLPDASWRAVSLSLLVGAATHNLWDAFTHQYAPGVLAITSLRTTWFTLGGYPLAGYAVLQQASNVLGCALLVYWAWRWLRAQTTTIPAPSLSPVLRRLILSALLIVPAAVAVIAMLNTPMPVTRLHGWHDSLKQATLAAMSSAGIAVLAYSLLWQLQSKRQRVAPSIT